MKTLIIRRVCPEIHRKLKAMAALEGKSIQDIVIELIKAYISDAERVKSSND